MYICHMHAMCGMFYGGDSVLCCVRQEVREVTRYAVRRSHMCAFSRSVNTNKRSQRAWHAKPLIFESDARCAHALSSLLTIK